MRWNSVLPGLLLIFFCFGPTGAVAQDSAPNAATESRSLTTDSNIELSDSANLFKGETTLLWTGTSGTTALGDRALASSTTGEDNTAVGHLALLMCTEGERNVAVGSRALHGNTTGSFNTGLGYKALEANSESDYNTALGDSALKNATGSSNTAVGFNSMLFLETGIGNVAVGMDTMLFMMSGSENTAVGWNALYNVSTPNPTDLVHNTALGKGAGQALRNGRYNLLLDHPGKATESHTIRIGTAFDDLGDGDPSNDNGHSTTHVSGIHGALVPSGAPVYIESDGRLGTNASSRRFKSGIEDLAPPSDVLLALRPVRFRYREDLVGSGEQPIQYGLIAEEVAEVLPELVSWDEQGRPHSVRYQLLTSLLLQQLQAERRERRTEADRLADLIERQARELEELRQRVQTIDHSMRR